MKQLVMILLLPRERLLATPSINELCITAKKIRQKTVAACVAFFAALIMVVIFHKTVAFELVLPVAAWIFTCFVLSAMLSSRFGRLCDAEKSIEYRSNIAHMCRMQPMCMDYYNQVRNSGRPFTRLDLGKLGCIYLREQTRRLEADKQNRT